MWIWNLFFGMARGHNDINVFDHSLIFDQFLQGRTPLTNYIVNGRLYTTCYYLMDGIYQKFSTFIQSITYPTTSKEKLFAQRPEAARKDVECTYQMLQIKWSITQGFVRYWNKHDLCRIMKMYILLYYMIIKDEHKIKGADWTPIADEQISFRITAANHLFCWPTSLLELAASVIVHMKFLETI